MIQYIISAGILYIFKEILSDLNNKPLTEFNNESIITDYAKFFKSNQEIIAKIHITKTLNKIIKQNKKFKIGKSGSPKNRNSQHKEFSKMFILAESENKEFINKLEAIYNEKYIRNKKNTNYKIGSAGEMTDKTGSYFLYVVIE